MGQLSSPVTRVTLVVALVLVFAACQGKRTSNLKPGTNPNAQATQADEISSAQEPHPSPGLGAPRSDQSLGTAISIAL